MIKNEKISRARICEPAFRRNTMTEIRMTFPSTERMNIHWRYRADDKIKQDEPDISHIHPYYEMYIYVSGENISFMVENRVFDLTPADIIFTKPNQYHHCIYHNDCLHEHYCIDIYTTDSAMTAFFDSLAEKAYLSYPDEDKKRLLSLCEEMNNAADGSDFMRLSAFYNIMATLQRKADSLVARTGHVTEPLDRILKYINTEFASITCSKDIAERFFISQNTLERLFKSELDISPYQYLLSVRMSNACRCLCDGKTVLEACSESGFGDYSHFISRFKKKFGMTPAEYRNLSCGKKG